MPPTRGPHARSPCLRLPDEAPVRRARAFTRPARRGHSRYKGMEGHPPQHGVRLADQLARTGSSRPFAAAVPGSIRHAPCGEDGVRSSVVHNRGSPVRLRSGGRARGVTHVRSWRASWCQAGSACAESSSRTRFELSRFGECAREEPAHACIAGASCLWRQRIAGMVSP